MAKYTKEELIDKMMTCIEILSSNMCNDKLYIMFVVTEFLMYHSAYFSDILIANKATTLSYLACGEYVYEYRNSFAHSNKLSHLIELIRNMANYSDDIIMIFPDSIRLKVLNALCI